jgi:hypothetical protein
MNFDVNIVVLVGQVILSGILVWQAVKKAPVERQSLDAGSAAQYAQAAKLKGEENEKLERELAEQKLEHDLEMSALRLRLDKVELKRYRVTMEFTIGDPPEMGLVKIEPILPDNLATPDHRNAIIKPKGKKTWTS